MSRITKVSFPGLGIGEFEMNTAAFELFGVQIAWYALFITLGMICAVLYVIYRSKHINISVDDIIDFALFTIPIGVVGARAYYVIMEWKSYPTFASMLDIRSGGLAIYGGIIAGAITVFAVCYFKKINFLAFADCVVPGLILAQAIGRWGNFVNGEAYGSVTSVPWRMCSPQIAYELISKELITSAEYTEILNGTLGVHPCFLYESLWNIVGFIAINLFYKHKKYDGQIFLMIFGWYGLGRAFIEGFRTDSLYLFGTDIRVSQALALLILVACAAALIYFAIKKPNKEFYVRKVAVQVDDKAKKDEAVDADNNESFIVKFKNWINKLWQK